MGVAKRVFRPQLRGRSQVSCEAKNTHRRMIRWLLVPGEGREQAVEIEGGSSSRK